MDRRLKIPHIQVDYMHHGVGQGLFTSGVLALDDVKMVWVHDCGSSSADAPALIDRGCQSIDAHLGATEERPRIELLAISHFDQDHISGVVQLIKRYRIGTILLPYYALWKRLVAGFAQNSGSGLTNFCVDPVAFLGRVDGAEIERFVLVDPEPSPPEKAGLGVKRWPGEAGGDGLFAATRPLQTVVDGASEPMAGHPGVRVELLYPGAPLLYADIWEFLPYADPKHAPADRPRFRREVDARLSRLQGAPDDANRLEALNELRTFFDRTFGRGAKARNRISLCLYSGPLSDPVVVNGHAEILHHTRSHIDRIGQVRGPSRRVGQLLTGDADLSSTAALKRFVRHYGPKTRLRRVCAFQVMHHGARTNSHAEIPAMINPRWSIFSSDPTRRYAHPDPEVRALYGAHGPMQVDKERTFRVTMQMVPSAAWLGRRPRQ